MKVKGVHPDKDHPKIEVRWRPLHIWCVHTTWFLHSAWCLHTSWFLDGIWLERLLRVILTYIIKQVEEQSVRVKSCDTAEVYVRQILAYMLDQKDDFGEDWRSILLWKISYTYTNENPYCEACRAENVA